VERWDSVIEILLLQALAYQECRQEQKALAALAQAVCLAEPAGYIRRFIDEGAPMAALLSKLQRQEREQGSTPYLDTLLAAYPSDGTKREQHIQQNQHPIKHSLHPKQDIPQALLAP